MTGRTLKRRAAEERDVAAAPGPWQSRAPAPSWSSAYPVRRSPRRSPGLCRRPSSLSTESEVQRLVALPLLERGRSRPRLDQGPGRAGAAARRGATLLGGCPSRFAATAWAETSRLGAGGSGPVAVVLLAGHRTIRTRTIRGGTGKPPFVERPSGMTGKPCWHDRSARRFLRFQAEATRRAVGGTSPYDDAPNPSARHAGGAALQ